MAQICQTTLFQGHVQGVGFRYSTQQIAEPFEVTGYVKNLPDGRVELVTEGAPKEIEQLLTAIRERFDGQIRNEQADTRPATDQYDRFEIRT